MIDPEIMRAFRRQQRVLMALIAADTTVLVLMVAAILWSYRYD